MKSLAPALVVPVVLTSITVAQAPADAGSAGGGGVGGGGATLTLPEGLSELAIGEASRWYFSVTGGVAQDVESDDDSNDFMGALAVHHFLSPEVELVGQVDLFYFDQDGDNAFGAGPSFELRWHFWQRGRWTVFANAGIGVIGSTDDAPAGGTSFNFTPRAGFGATYRIGADNTRLVGGIRWHHISNATISGDDDNPDRDGAMFYAGVMFPF